MKSKKKISSFTRFQWKIAGAECNLLEKSGNESQERFKLIGSLNLMIYSVVIISITSTLWGVFGSFVSLLASCIVSFLIINIYRLLMLNLQPNSLPTSASKINQLSGNIVRYTIVLIFAVYVSKGFELFVAKCANSIMEFPFLEAQTEMSRLIEINTKYSGFWVLTSLVCFLFVVPVHLKISLVKMKQYYTTKREKDIELVKQQFELFRKRKFEILTSVYKEYEKIGDQRKYQLPLEKYQDPPFNTKLIPNDRVDYMNQSQFLENFYG